MSILTHKIRLTQRMHSVTGLLLRMEKLAMLYPMGVLLVWLIWLLVMETFALSDYLTQCSNQDCMKTMIWFPMTQTQAH